MVWGCKFLKKLSKAMLFNNSSSYFWVFFWMNMALVDDAQKVKVC